MDVKNLSSNWKKLQANLAGSSSGPKKDSLTPERNGLRKRSASQSTLSQPKRQKQQQTMKVFKPRQGKISNTGDNGDGQKAKASNNSLGEDVKSEKPPGNLINSGLCTGVDVGKYVAIDCEMVGVGPNPDRESALARVSMVNFNGDQIYDSFVRPRETVTDWRTHVSGIAPHHMTHARSLEEVQTDVAAIIKDRIVVGHSVRSDFDALLLSHPRRDIRDTARHPPYRKLAGGGSPKLKILASELLGLEIQTGEHSSVEDARATILLFRRDKEAFEREHAKKWPTRPIAVKETHEEDADDLDSSKKKSKKKKKKKK